MAIREFQCNDCGHITEVISNNPDERPSECRCGHGKFTKLFSAVGGYKINGANGASTRPKSSGAFRKAKVVAIAIISLLGFKAEARPLTTDQLQIMKDIIWAADFIGVPKAVLLTVCWGEGSFGNKRSLTHPDGGSLSHGTCQVKLATAQFMDYRYNLKIKATSRRLQDPKINAFYAAQFVKYQLIRYRGDWKLAIDAYNKGTGRSRDSAYVQKFIKDEAFIFKKLKEMEEEIL